MKQGRPNSLLFIIFLLSVLHGILSGHSFLSEPKQDEAMRLELIHRHSLKLKGLGLRDKMPKTQLELIEELRSHDLIRQQMISRKKQNHHRHIQTARRRNVLEAASHSASASIAMPLSSGWDFGVGQYFVQVKVGTPSQKFMLIADTGSDLTWMKCKYRCTEKCGRKRAKTKTNKKKKKVFRATRSSTFKTVPCSSDMCKFELDFSRQICPTPSSPCKYDYRYVENCSALGFFAKETVRVPLTDGRSAKLNDVLIGCTESIEGPKEASIWAGDGIMGLGFGKHSFVAKAASNLGHKFSYCLVDHMSSKNVSSYLRFGGNAEPALRKRMSYTKLVLGGPNIGPLYAVNLAGISVGGKMLKIPKEVWAENLGGGTIVDSGTSLTFLTSPAYIPVMAELTIALSKYEIITLDAFEFCFNSTGYDESLVPRFAVHFADGAKFEPPVKSYVVDVSAQTKCLGFVSSLFPGTIVIGNIMEQNYLWEFDLQRGTLGFASSSCT